MNYRSKISDHKYGSWTEDKRTMEGLWGSCNLCPVTAQTTRQMEQINTQLVFSVQSCWQSHHFTSSVSKTIITSLLWAARQNNPQGPIITGSRLVTTCAVRTAAHGCVFPPNTNPTSFFSFFHLPAPATPQHCRPSADLAALAINHTAGAEVNKQESRRPSLTTLLTPSSPKHQSPTPINSQQDSDRVCLSSFLSLPVWCHHCRWDVSLIKDNKGILHDMWAAVESNLIHVFKYCG